VVQPSYSIGQAITARIEVKNSSKKRRFIYHWLEPVSQQVNIEFSGPNGKVEQNVWVGGQVGDDEERYLSDFKPIGPGEIKKFEIIDLRTYFPQLYPGKYVLRLRFRSPKVPKRHPYGVFPAEVIADQWANEIRSLETSFELKVLAKEDLIVHEWGVFSLFNNERQANMNRKEEWGALPSFFYRQFPKERLCWRPAYWDKPIVYVYAKPTPLHITVEVTFVDGVPVVWWPGAADPIDRSRFPKSEKPKEPRPFRSLMWSAWVGDTVPIGEVSIPASSRSRRMTKVSDFPLPARCWLNDARLAGASRLTVVGNIEGQPKYWSANALDRPETEGFLYYDGLVPAPQYLRCEKLGEKNLTVRNMAGFDITRLFLIDRRDVRAVRFAFLDSLKHGSSLSIETISGPARDWPAIAVSRFRSALVQAGLFEAEADSLLKIWQKRLFEADGVTAFHILPAAEYGRMLRLEITPVPFAKPTRVGVALHTHLELDPTQTQTLDALVRQLDETSYERRSAATEALERIGPPALAALRAALKQNLSQEQIRRIQEVVKQAETVERSSIK
jgi:hypothetical protein